VVSTVAASPVPLAGGFLLALGLFAAWTAFLIRSDQRRVAWTAFAAPDDAVATSPATTPVQARAEVDAPERPHLFAVPAPPEGATPAPEEVGADAGDEPGRRPVVRPGAFCTQVGAAGVTTSGTAMICSSADGARPRWRRAGRSLPRSA